MGTVRLKDIDPKVGGQLKALIHMLCFFCPMCGDNRVYDKRYKEEVSGYQCRIYRLSVTSGTLECKHCGLRFMVTWRGFVKALRRLADDKRLKGEDEDAHHYEKWIPFLNQVVEADYRSRKPPHKLP